jgi:hypothetical protein
MVDSSCVVIGLFSQVHLLSFPFFSAILCHSPLFSPISVPVVSHLCIILSIFHSFGAQAHQMNDSVSFSSSLQGFFRPHARRSVAGRWLAIQFSPLSGRHFALISSPSDAERRKFGQAKEKERQRKSTKKQEKIQKMKQKIDKTRHRCVSLFCSVVVIELFSSHFACLFPLLSCSLNSKKKYCKYIRRSDIRI